MVRRISHLGGRYAREGFGKHRRDAAHETALPCGRAYRAGRLICGWVQVTISDDERLGLTEQERCLVRVRFHEPLDDGLRCELTRLLRRRGAAAGRVAQRIDPIEVVVDDPDAERERIVGRVEPPQVHHGPLGDVEFALRRLEPRR